MKVNLLIMVRRFLITVLLSHEITSGAANLREREAGVRGGGLVVAQRGEPKTLNPLIAADSASREVINRMMADLIHINRDTQHTEAALAESWTVSPDGRRYIIRLRQGVRFSDGHAFDADDVIFSFQAYLDEKVHSPQRDLLIIGGKPIAVHKRDPFTVIFDLALPYAAAERLFDGLAMLPRHLLLKSYQDRTLVQAWALNTPPAQIAGLGPFRLQMYVPGRKIVLERNPYYWKTRDGTRLPYLDSLMFVPAGTEDAQVLRFETGETDVISRMSARNYAVLESRHSPRRYMLKDLGPGLEYNFLFYNQNDLSGKNLPQIAAHQVWFRQLAFRQAVSSAIDREGIAKVVFQGRATPLWGNVTPGNKMWLDTNLQHPPQSLDRAKRLLASAGFSWNESGGLRDAAGRLVEFPIIASASNPERVQIATIIQDDLRKIGIHANIVSLEFRALLDRIFQSYDYDACILGLAAGDTDPNPEMNVWLSFGATHLWELTRGRRPDPWQAEIDDLMRRQMTTLQHAERKRLYDRVQQIIAEYLPVTCLVSPNVLVGAKVGLGNFKPAILDHYTLWNVDELYWREKQSGKR